jgi:membrane protein
MHAVRTIAKTDIEAVLWRTTLLNWRGLLRRVVRQFKLDRVADQSAQLSYYFFFAVFPLLIFLTALLGLFVEPGSFLHKAVSNYISAVLPGSASKFIESELGEISRGSSAGKLSLGLIAALWSASSGMGAIIKSLNVAYGATKRRPWWKEKLLAIGLTIVVTVLMISALLLVIYGGGMASDLASQMGMGHSFAMIWGVAQWPVLLLFVVLAFSLVYYFAPNIKHMHWQWLMPGTAIGVTLWLTISFGFRYYVHYFNRYNILYGSIGAIIILLLWFYLSGIAILIGGEVNSTIELALDRRKR